MKHTLILIAALVMLPGQVLAQEASFVRSTPTTQAIGKQMAQRFAQIRPLLDTGVVGFGSDGMLVVRQAPEGLGEAARVRALVAQDNSDRRAVVAELARANGKPQWRDQVQASFARQWIDTAKPGWYYQDASGNWVRK